MDATAWSDGTATVEMVGYAMRDGEMIGPARISLVRDERGAISVLVEALRNEARRELHFSPDTRLAEAVARVEGELRLLTGL